MREQILSILAQWDALKAEPRWRLGGVLAGLAGLGLLLSLPLPEGLSETGRRAGAITLLLSGFWLGGVLPMAVTALIPLVAFPLLGLMSVNEAAAPYADPLIFLMLGGSLLACAMEEVGLHRRILALLLAPAAVRRDPRRVVLALMATATAVSGFISNTATMLMMVPLALSVVASLQPHLPDTARLRLRSAAMLGLAYSCSIGGVATLVGTAPNAVLARTAAGIGREVSFLQWSLIGVPFVLICLPLAWLVITRVAIPLPDRCSTPLQAPAPPPWLPGEATVLLTLAACLLAWVTRQPIDLGFALVPGWSSLLPAKVDDGWVSIVAVLLLFLLPRPAGLPLPPQQNDLSGEDASEDRFLLSWRRAARRIPWSVLLLLGGGFSMARAIETSKLTDWLAGEVSGISALPPALAVLLICVGISTLSAFTSNTATTQVALPFLAAGAQAAGIDPLLWMIPATISASCDFTMAVGTPPNAIAAEVGQVAASDMAFAGIFLNVICAVVVTGLCVWWVPLVG